MKLEVLVLEPEIVQYNEYVCDFCNMTYSSDDYKLLYDSKKLVDLAVPYYLAYDFEDGSKESCSSTLDLCHSCFYSHLSNSSAKKPIEITFLQNDKEITKFYDPNDDETDDATFFFLPNG